MGPAFLPRLQGICRLSMSDKVRERQTTWAPASQTNAMAFPIPRPAPVTTTCSLSIRSWQSFLCRLQDDVNVHLCSFSKSVCDEAEFFQLHPF